METAGLRTYHQPPKTNHQSPIIDLTAEEAMATEQPEAFESGLETDLDAGWFFVLEERPGDVRFGADVPEKETGLNGYYDKNNENNIVLNKGWKQLSWGHLSDAMGINDLSNFNYLSIGSSNMDNGIVSDDNKDPIWGKNSANLAHIFFQPHNRVVIHADQMIK